jgi:hypothetical protein
MQKMGILSYLEDADNVIIWCIIHYISSYYQYMIEVSE